MGGSKPGTGDNRSEAATSADEQSSLASPSSPWKVKLNSTKNRALRQRVRTEFPKETSFLDDTKLLKSNVFRKRFDRAATKVQKIVRGRRVRHSLAEIVKQMQLSKSALKIQSVFRGFMTRQKQAISLLEGQLELINLIKTMELQAVESQKKEYFRKVSDAQENKTKSRAGKKSRSVVKVHDVIALLRTENEESKRKKGELQCQSYALIQENKALEQAFLDTTEKVASLEIDIQELEKENKQWQAYIEEFQRHSIEFEVAIRETDFVLAEEQNLKYSLQTAIAKVEKRVSGNSTFANGNVGDSTWCQNAATVSITS